MMKIILIQVTVLSFLLLLPAHYTYANPPAFPTEKKIIYDAAFSKHGHVLFVADGMSIKAFSFDDRQLIREFDNEHTGQIMSLSVSADSTLIASGDRNGTLVLHCMESGRSLHTFSDHEGIIMGTDISNDRQFIATGSTDNNVVLYDLSKREIVDVFKVHDDDVLGIKFSPCGRWLVSVGADGKIAVFDMDYPKLHHLVEDMGFFVRDVDFSHDGQSFITAGDDGHYYTWNISEMSNTQPTRSTRKLTHWVTSIDHSESEPVFVLANTRGNIHLFTNVFRLTINIKAHVHRVLLRPSDDLKAEIIAATRGKGIVLVDGTDMRTRSR